MSHQWTSEEVRVLSQLGSFTDSQLSKVIAAVWGWECPPSTVRAMLQRNGVSRSTRSARTAKAAGSRFEQEVADLMAERLEDDRIVRMPKHGNRDRGDISGVRLRGERYVIEAKNCRDFELSDWVNQAEREAGNDDAAFWAVVHKRKQHGAEGAYVTMTADQWLRQVWGA